MLSLKNDWISLVVSVELDYCVIGLCVFCLEEPFTTAGAVMATAVTSKLLKNVVARWPPVSE